MRIQLCLLSLCSLLFCAATLSAGEQPGLTLDADSLPRTLKGLPLLHSTGFDDAGLDAWKSTDASAWKVAAQGENRVLMLTKKKSDYQPKVRSPFNQAILKKPVVTDFVLDVRLQSTEPDYGHRSLCLFFGYQDPSHFYYVHFGKQTDDHANQIFIVNDAPRTKISTKTTPGTNWDDEWHHARVVRDVETGKIEVYFDDMTTPVMIATDKTFTHGRVGVGSFDDRGNFDHVLLYGEKAAKMK